MQHYAHRPILVMVGTRPEGIKMIPVYCALRKAGLPTLLCSTAQHKQLLAQVFTLFDVHPDIDLDVMKQGQDLFYLTSSILQKTKQIFQQYNPSLILVQGDTTTAMVAALSAFYLGIPIGHVEAGLRTFDMKSPFPEEMNRRFIGLIAQYHFAPTAQAAAHLLAEGVARESVFCTGNTVVDALRIMKNKIDMQEVAISANIMQHVAACKAAGKKLILLTVHRRESFNGGIKRVLSAVQRCLQQYENLCCLYPYHPNPAVIQALDECAFTKTDNVYVCEPLSYQDLVYVLLHADVVITDSGGIQEEAVSLCKQVLVVRDKSERMEGIWAGCARLVGTQEHVIQQALEDALYKNHVFNASSVYGDGFASDKIVEIIKHNRVINDIQHTNQKICSNDQEKAR